MNHNLESIAQCIEAGVDRLFAMPTSEWPEDVKIDTRHLGPRVTEQQKTKLRLSHGLNCGRRQWYVHNEPEKSVPPNALVNLKSFSPGDLWEAYAHPLLPHCMPNGWTYYDAGDLELEVVELFGHLDGLMIHEDGSVIVTDSKFTSDYVIKKWERGMPDGTFGYLAQATNYMFGVENLINDINEGREHPNLALDVTQRTNQCNALKALPKNGKVIGFMWTCMVQQPFGKPWFAKVGHARRDDRELASMGKQTLRQYHDARTQTKPPCRWGNKPCCRFCSFEQHCNSDAR